VGFEVVFLGFEVVLGVERRSRAPMGGAIFEGPSLSFTFDIGNIKTTNVYQRAPLVFKWMYIIHSIVWSYIHQIHR
jgi:hypothetical protein